MKKFLFFALAVVLFSGAAAAQQDELTIREIIVEGGITLTVDTVSYYLGLEPEDPLDIEFITDGYRRLWDSGLFEDIQIDRVLAVSHFYHLPRIKMTYQRQNMEVFTVPAKESRMLAKMPIFMLREVAAIMVYYVRPLVP